MRPKLITPAKVFLALLAIVIFAALVLWLNSGSKIPFVGGVPSTAGKLAFVREENGTSDLFMVDGATGANAVALTNDGKGADNEPAWSPEGDSLALTSDRNGVVRQLCLMDAKPGAPVVGRTNTSSTKELPQYGPDQDVFYLDGGRISKISPVSGDINAVFPTADQKRGALEKLFEFGGITRFAVSADGSRIYAAVKQERGEALVVWAPQENIVAALGVAEKVLFAFSGNDLIAVFAGGEPYPKAIVLMNEQNAKIDNSSDGSSMPGLPPLEASEVKAVVKIDETLAITPLVPIPFTPSGLAITPDNKKAALTSEDTKVAGIFVFEVENPKNGGQITGLPASEPAFSPDGATLAFTSGKDIYTVPTSGGEPKKLTQGKGQNFAPTWSPAKPKK